MTCENCGDGDGPHYQGGPQKNVRFMVAATAALRDEGGLPAEASLVFTQLLLNLAGKVGGAEALILINNFLLAADVPTGLPVHRPDRRRPGGS